MLDNYELVYECAETGVVETTFPNFKSEWESFVFHTFADLQPAVQCSGAFQKIEEAHETCMTAIQQKLRPIIEEARKLACEEILKVRWYKFDLRDPVNMKPKIIERPEILAEDVGGFLHHVDTHLARCIQKEHEEASERFEKEYQDGHFPGMDDMAAECRAQDLFDAGQAALNFSKGRQYNGVKYIM